MSILELNIILVMERHLKDAEGGPALLEEQIYVIQIQNYQSMPTRQTQK